jgi:hypothetical protein
MRSCIAALILFAEDIRGETVEENVITKPDLIKTGLSDFHQTCQEKIREAQKAPGKKKTCAQEIREY